MSLKFAGTSDRCYRNDNDADGTALDFSSSVEWTISMFARFTDLDATQNCALISKFCTSGTFSGSLQALLRVTNGGAPTSIHVYKPGQLHNTAFSEEDVWYLISCSCDGSSGITLYIFEMDGTAAIDGETDTAGSDDSNLTAPIELGSWNEGAKDPMIGELAFCCYSESKWSRDQTLSYLRNPHRFASLGDTAFFLPLLGTNASSEPDWSGNGRNFTRAGCTTGDNPPVATLGFDLGWRGITAVVSGAEGTSGLVTFELAQLAATAADAVVSSTSGIATCELSQSASTGADVVVPGTTAIPTIELGVLASSGVVSGTSGVVTIEASVLASSGPLIAADGTSGIVAIELGDLSAIGASLSTSATSSVVTIEFDGMGGIGPVRSGIVTVELSQMATSVAMGFKTGVSDIWRVPAGGSLWAIPSGGDTWTVP